MIIPALKGEESGEWIRFLNLQNLFLHIVFRCTTFWTYIYALQIMSAFKKSCAHIIDLLVFRLQFYKYLLTRIVIFMAINGMRSSLNTCRKKDLALKLISFFSFFYRYIYMVGTQKKYHLISMARRKVSFMQICGPLIQRLGNGIRLACFLFHIFTY